MASAARPVGCVAMIDWTCLDEFLLAVILYQLPHRSLFRASRVCKRWHSVIKNLVNDAEYWHTLCEVRCSDVAGIMARMPEIPLQNGYQFFYVNFLRGLQQGVKLMKDPYIGAPYFTHSWSCNVCNYNSKIPVYHCMICSVYDMCPNCYAKGRRGRHDCVRMTDWWYANYRRYVTKRPPTVEVSKLLTLKASASQNTAARDLMKISLNFEETEPGMEEWDLNDDEDCDDEDFTDEDEDFEVDRELSSSSLSEDEDS
ncbi:hypothetical protein Pelo_8839 [Pelomyxa schiedti]|nr:hypothetical protein Pelo_8839 [Pelomyxa schiedti]